MLVFSQICTMYKFVNALKWSTLAKYHTKILELKHYLDLNICDDFRNFTTRELSLDHPTLFYCSNFIF